MSKSTVAIIGGGLAGTACAFVLKQRGFVPVIYEAGEELAVGASGNEVGLYNPRFTSERCPEQEFYAAAFFKALELFAVLEGIDWNPCGALHLVTDEKKAKRFPKTAKNWGWSKDNMQFIGAEEASRVAGIPLAQDALYLPRSGTVSPYRLCHVYARGVDVRLECNIEDFSNIGADYIILAAGMGLKKFDMLQHVPLKPVRGQVSYVRQTDLSANLKCTIGYGGYITPVQGGAHCLGSSFQPWLDHDEILMQDDKDNLEKLFAAVPALKAEYEVSGHRAGVRTTVKDHFPVVGQTGERMYVTTGHGSHGILSSLMAAHIIADLIEQKRPNVAQSVLESLSPQRFS